MNLLFRMVRFLRYYLKAGNRHHLHSPFVYQLNEAVFRKDKEVADYKIIEAVRRELSASNDQIPTEDYGAGSVTGKGSNRKLKEIVRSSSKSPRYARLLYRLVNYLKPETMLELGTAVGISGLYQCMGNPSGRLITLEGNRKLAAIATDVLKNCRAEVVAGSFESMLPDSIRRYQPFQYVFLDGNHRREPVLNYFNLIFPALAEEAVIVVDDINWSDEMQAAWQELKADPRIQVSIDLFQLGLLFVRPGLSKQDFTIRY